jgi:hypothetical protein
MLAVVRERIPASHPGILLTTSKRRAQRRGRQGVGLVSTRRNTLKCRGFGAKAAHFPYAFAVPDSILKE